MAAQLVASRAVLSSTELVSYPAYFYDEIKLNPVNGFLSKFNTGYMYINANNKQHISLKMFFLDIFNLYRHESIPEHSVLRL
jgi:hypothetical protein